MKNFKNKPRKINLRGKKVVVMGLGFHGGGVGTAKFFAKQGAKVLVTDTKSKKELQESLNKLKKFKNIKYILGKHRAGDFKNADLIIKNPGAPKDSKYLKIARKNKVPVETDIGLFFELCPSEKIIGITGTKGKSTTATLITKLLKTKYNTVLAGNIRASALEKLSEINKNTIVVLELSSWQLEDLKPYKKAPHIAVITNIMPDHLNRHKGMKDYIEAKKIIFRFQKPEDYLILNNDDKIVRKFAKEANSKAIFYSKIQANPYLRHIKTREEHNLYHISSAVIVVKIFKVSKSLIKKELEHFKGLEGRLELIKEIRGIKYYNDTTATIPEATIAALKTFPAKKIILIAGGTDKNLKFKKLAKEINKRVKLLILLPGTATKKMASRQEAIKVKSMQEAVKTAAKNAEKGDIVLLSPASASFGLFKHEFDRGEQFKKYVKK